jgi:hypothetical protein
MIKNHTLNFEDEFSNYKDLFGGERGGLRFFQREEYTEFTFWCEMPTGWPCGHFSFSFLSLKNVLLRLADFGGSISFLIQFFIFKKVNELFSAL